MKSSKSKPELGLYWCSGCVKNLPKECFCVSKTRSTGVTSRCKACNVASAVAWNRANKEKYAENCARYRAKPEAKAISNAWRENNKQHLHAATNEWRRNNPDKWKEIVKRSRQKNIEKVLIRNREREILEGRAMPPWAGKQRIRAIYAEAKELSRSTGKQHHVDHIYPLKGKTVCGLHVEGNLQILTAVDNLKKFNKFEEVSP